MKARTKRSIFILLSLISLLLLAVWLTACLFAAGQLYDTYDLRTYLADAPAAVLILLVLFAAFTGFVIAAIRAKDTDKNTDQT